jgi:serine O-acetyltransferase
VKFPEWLYCLKEDFRVFCMVYPRNKILSVLYLPDFRVVFIYRVAQLCHQVRFLRVISYVLSAVNDFIHGVWISGRVQAGPGLFLGHPRGLVVHPDTRIGGYCSIVHRVTIGGPKVTIGDFVEIGAGAQIISNERGIGELHVGSNVLIGAGAVVVRDVPSNSVAVGVPARVVKTINPEDNWVAFRTRKNAERN